MKRVIAILLAVMMLTGVLTACSGTAYYDDGYGYGNVSTTPDGRVNGTNGRTNGSYSWNGTGNYTGTNNSGTYTGTYTGTNGSSNTGTGMVGSR